MTMVITTMVITTKTIRLTIWTMIITKRTMMITIRAFTLCVNVCLPTMSSSGDMNILDRIVTPTKLE